MSPVKCGFCRQWFWTRILYQEHLKMCHNYQMHINTKAQQRQQQRPATAAINLSASEYNALMDDLRALNRLGEILLDERGVDELTIGNVYIYRAEGGGVGSWFVDENGNRLKPTNHAFMDYGIGTPNIKIT